LRSKKKSRRATSANKITIDKKEVENNAREARETKLETRKIEVDAKADARATTIAATIATTIVDKKQLLKLCEQFVCTYVSLVLEIASILSSCLLLFDNLRKYANNTLYSQRLIKLLN